MISSKKINVLLTYLGICCFISPMILVAQMGCNTSNISILANSSFENNSGCPTTFKQFNLVQNWVSGNDEAIDYLNNCSYRRSTSVPFPDGNGVAGCFYLKDRLRYIGQCLSTPLNSGTNYMFNFDVSALSVDNAGGQIDLRVGDLCPFSYNSIPYPVTIALYGTPNCTDLPWTGTGSPTGHGSWILLGQVIYDPSDTLWTNLSINFAAPSNIAAIAFGPPEIQTQPLPTFNQGGFGNIGCFPFIQYDDILLNQASLITDVSIAKTGGLCTNDVILTASCNQTGGSWQWYKNGNALVGETGIQLHVSSNNYGNGDYLAKYIIGSDCFTDMYHLKLPTAITVNFTTATSCMENIVACNDQSFGGAKPIVGWNWYFGDGSTSNEQHPVHTYTPNANYMIKLVVTTAEGCKDSITKLQLVNRPIPLSLSSCNCNGLGLNLIPNPSFEDHACCPNNFSQLSCANSWIQASDATSDYYNTCDSTFYSNGFHAPLPAEGNGIAGFWDLGTTYKEYIGTCLSQPMRAGETYHLSFQMAHSPDYNNPPFSVTFWGATNCTDLPFAGFRCPSNTGSWQLLGQQNNLNLSSASWQTINMSITLTQDIDAILIGPNCSDLKKGRYYFVDDLKLSGAMLQNIVGTGSYCANNLVLKLGPGSNNNQLKYQWFKNGVELIGEMDSLLYVSAHNHGPGDYQVLGVLREACGKSPIFHVDSAYVTFTSTTVPTCPNPATGQIVVTTITGQGNTPPYHIQVNNNAATTNTVFTNLAPGNYSVTITDSLGCKNMDTVVINAFPVPHAFFIADTACFGTVTSFTNQSNITSGTLTSWQWTFDSAPISSNLQNPTHVFPSLANGNVSLTVTSNHGCRDSISIPVALHALPSLSVNPAGTICKGMSITQTITGANSYTWSPTSGLNTTIGSSVIANPGATSSYTVTGTDAYHCVNSVSFQITVFPLPTANFKADSVCLNNITHLLDNSTGNGFPLTNYTWDFDANGSIDTIGISNTNHLFSHSGVTAVSYTVTSTPIPGLSCMKDTIQTIWVNPLPIAAFTFTNTCINTQPMVFNASGSNIAIGTNTAYTWAYGDMSSTSVITNTTTHTYSASGIYDVTLTVTSNKGCQSSISQQTEVYQKPFATILNSNACDTKPMTFTATAQPNSGTIVNWHWDFNNVISTIEANGQTSNYIFQSAGAQTVALISETDKGCRDTLSKPIYIDYVPKPLFSVDYPNVCPLSQCVVFTDHTLPIPGPGITTNWKWILGDGTVLNALNNASQSHCYSNLSSSLSAFFDVKLIVSTDKGCIDSLQKLSFITVYPKPIAQYIATPNPGNVVTPLTYFTNQSVDYTKWWWYFGDSPTCDSVNKHPTHFYESETAASYYSLLIVANKYGCMDTAMAMIEIGPEFTFYIPNTFTPNNDDGINDLFTGKGIGIEKYEMWIFDRWGEQIYYTTDITTGWDGTVQGKSNEKKQDVYTWKVSLKDIFGKKHDYVGHVTLLK